MRTWQSVLAAWRRGNYPTHFQRRRRPERWLTSPIAPGTPYYAEEFLPDDALPVRQDWGAFASHIRVARNRGERHVTHFPSLSGASLLVVPMPRANKDFATLHSFSIQASPTQQRAFWRRVALLAERLARAGPVFVNAHGLNVPYLHVRLDRTPLYYGRSRLRKPVTKTRR